MNRKIDRWLVDTGCGYDLVSREHTTASKRWVRKAVHLRTFQTANGITTTDKVVRMTVDEFGEEFHLMSSIRLPRFCLLDTDV